jgi:hypothetical protein
MGELDNNPNPFPLVVLAHLESLATNQQPTQRYQAKWGSGSV